MKELDLKPCPFCGSENAEPQIGGISGLWIICNTCYATGGIGETEEQAIAAWNRRAACQCGGRGSEE